MHSLKNTIVAVGLLGLSFVLYQLSDKKPQSNDELQTADQVANPTSELADAMPSANVLDPNADSPLIKLEMPSLTSGAKLQPPATMRLADSQSKSASTKNLPAPNSLSAPRLSQPGGMPSNAMPAKNQSRPNSNFDANQFGADQSPQNRDSGLIAALESQKNEGPSSGKLPVKQISTGSNRFGMAPLSARSRDSSFTQFAGGGANTGKSAVVVASKLDAAHAGENGFSLSDNSAAPDQPPQLSFRDAWPKVEQLVAEEKFADALKLLTKFYSRSDLTVPQRQRLNAWLDALAGKVIFSAEHHLGPPHVVVAGESLADLGQQWRVPGQLIYNVNRTAISNPVSLQPGTRLKQIKGPFTAGLDMSSNTMTLYVGEMYAGRYPVKIGVSGTPRAGKFKVKEKNLAGHEWRDAVGKAYPLNDANNGYGKHWIGLEGHICIHAVDDAKEAGHLGSIGLSPLDAKDVFAILGKGSVVKIR